MADVNQRAAGAQGGPVSEPFRISSWLGRGHVVGALLRSVLPGILAVHITVSLLMHLAHSQALEAQLAQEMRGVVTSRSQLVAEPLWRLQYDKIKTVLDEIVAIDSVGQAWVIDDSGATVAAAGHAVAPARRLTASHDIVYRDGNLSAFAGRMFVEYDRSRITTVFWEGVRDAILVAALAAVATAAGLWFAARRIIGRPLAAIAHAVEASAREGKRVKAEVTADNEIGSLAIAFNEMQDAACQMERQRDHLATHDHLTGLANRRCFEQAFRLATADPKGQALALHFVDMDGFKRINDSFGHAAGDRFLVHVASQLEAAAGDASLVARIGGDEFLILQRVSADEEAKTLSARLMSALSEPLEIDGRTLVPRACIGVAVRPVGHSEVETLPALADAALYRAKAEGPGRISVLDGELHRAHVRTRELESAIAEALAGQDFEAWFQGQFDFTTGQVRTFEALARWRRPADGIVGPVEFMPLIERNRLGPRLTASMLDCACRAVRTFRDAGHRDFRVALNMSAPELSDIKVVDRFRWAAERHDIPLDALEVELTEDTLITGFDIVSGVVSELRGLGITVALDDFGTGYSSLAYLRRLPLDKVKVDKAFVRDLATSPEARAVFETIVLLARRLDLAIVAEGIEDEAHADLVRMLGAELGQGYLYHRPAPLADVLDRLPILAPVGSAVAPKAA